MIGGVILLENSAAGPDAGLQKNAGEEKTSPAYQEIFGRVNDALFALIQK